MPNIEQVLQDFVDMQREMLRRNAPSQGVPGMVQRAGVGNLQTAQNFYATGGLFADCSLQQSVVNAVMTPMDSLANMIPVEATTEEMVKTSFVTQILDGEAGPQDYPCDPAPQIGDIASCVMTQNIGRLEISTKTLELDALIRKAHRGIQEDLFFVGDVRGVSTFASESDIANQDIVAQGAVQQQMSLWGRRVHKILNNWFWNGDPTNVALNGTNGGWKSFWGLNSLIATDYSSKAGVTGTNCAALNSYRLDFAGATNGGIVGQDNLYGYMQDMESELYFRALTMGLLPLELVIVMNPRTWEQVVKFLPCDMISDSCSGASVSANVNINVNDGGSGLFNLATRQQIMNTMTIDLNGRTYKVVLDYAIPVVTVAPTPPATVNRYRSSIYFVPLSADSQNVLMWKHMDYTKISPALAGIPAPQQSQLGWTDGGRYHFVVDQKRRCFDIQGKVEPLLVFKAPHLAGRIDNVTVAPLANKVIVAA